MVRSVAVKRVYEPPLRKDGTRVLVDRLWPRGLTKERAAVDAWLRELAPSHELRQWFHQHPEAWTLFHKRYLKELARPEASAPLEELYRLASESPQLTLVFASKNEVQNNAVVLRGLLEGMRKPPTGTGQGKIRATRGRQAKSMPRG
jgi:uncharacterized protein YeaO (DUF488 family)